MINTSQTCCELFASAIVEEEEEDIPVMTFYRGDNNDIGICKIFDCVLNKNSTIESVMKSEDIRK